MAARSTNDFYTNNRKTIFSFAYRRKQNKKHMADRMSVVSSCSEPSSAIDSQRIAHTLHPHYCCVCFGWSTGKTAPIWIDVYYIYLNIDLIPLDLIHSIHYKIAILCADTQHTHMQNNARQPSAIYRKLIESASLSLSLGVWILCLMCNKQNVSNLMQSPLTSSFDWAEHRLLGLLLFCI